MLASPCINVCQMDPARQLCLGCWRSLDEIARWARTDEAGQAAILAAVARRRPDAAGEGQEQPEVHRHG